MILFYSIVKREHKKTCSKWRKFCSLCLGWKGKIKTSKIDYYTFHQTFIFPQNQLLPLLQQHWCWRLPGSGVSLSHRIKGLQAVFGQLLPFLLILILGIPAQAMTAVLLCSHHAFRLTARPGSSHSRCGRRVQPLSDPQFILPGMTLEFGEGNVKFWLVQFPLQGAEVIFSPFRELIRNNSLAKHRLVSTQKSGLGR